MTLLLIITDYGSFNNFLTELALKFISDDNNNLHVICSKSKVIDIENKLNTTRKNILFHYVDIPRTTNLFLVLKAAIIIRRLVTFIKPDIVHSHFTTATLPAILFKRRKYVYWATFHGLGMNSTNGVRKLIFTFIEFFSFMNLDKIFVVNNTDYAVVKKYFPKKVSKYQSLGFGCDLEKFSKRNIKDVDKLMLAKEIGIDKETTVISYTGRFVEFKGFNLVIKCFKILTDNYPGKFKLILMGGTDPTHPTGLTFDETCFFKQSENIINIGYTKDVNKYLSITDIFLFPSKKEGLPTCVLEALAMGLPVITFNTRGNNDVISNNYNGLLIDPCLDSDKERNQIVDCINNLCANFVLYNTLSNNAIINREAYSRNIFVLESMQHYSKLS